MPIADHYQPIQGMCVIPPLILLGFYCRHLVAGHVIDRNKIGGLSRCWSWN